MNANVINGNFKNLGADAFARGVNRSPLLDPELPNPYLSIENMKAWLAGWDSANLAAPLPGTPKPCVLDLRKPGVLAEFLSSRDRK